jgi:hypothetical protein
MAQADYVVANGTGAAVRSDLNGQLAAIVSNNSGATEPATMYAYQWWADTTTGLLKLRNSANSAWVTIRQLDGEFSTVPVENGTAAAPSIYFKDSGTDSGFFSPGTDAVAISTAGANRLHVTSAGLVGIGTSSPGSNLDLAGTTSRIRWDLNNAYTLATHGNAAFSAFASSVQSAADYQFQIAGITKMSLDASGLVGIGTASPGAALEINAAAATSPFIAKINTSEAARIDSSKRLLVGTSSAYSQEVFGAAGFEPKIQVNGTAGDGISIVGWRNTGNYPGNLWLARSNSDTIGTHALVTDGQKLGEILFSGSDGTDFENAASIKVEVDGTAGANDMPGRIVLSTTASGASSPTQQMTLDNAGNLKFNSGYGSAATAYGCRAWVNFNGTGTVAIRGSGNVSSITDNATGDYTVNFTTAMPDNNYAISGFATSDDTSPTHQWGFVSSRQASEQVVGSVRITSNLSYSATTFNSSLISVAIFR